MRSSQRRLLAAALAGGLTAAALAGCSTTPSSISGADIEKKIGKDLAKGTKSDDVTCTKIAFKVGAKSTCEETLATPEGVVGAFTVAVTMTKAAGDGKYEFSYKRLLPAKEFHVTGASVAADLKEQWDQSQDTPATAATCPDLLAKVGASITCQVTAGGTVKVTTKVTEANPSTLAVKYDFSRA